MVVANFNNSDCKLRVAGGGKLYTHGIRFANNALCPRAQLEMENGYISNTCCGTGDSIYCANEGQDCTWTFKGTNDTLITRYVILPNLVKYDIPEMGLAVVKSTEPVIKIGGSYAGNRTPSAWHGKTFEVTVPATCPRGKWLLFQANKNATNIDLSEAFLDRFYLAGDAAWRSKLVYEQDGNLRNVYLKTRGTDGCSILLR